MAITFSIVLFQGQILSVLLNMTSDSELTMFGLNFAAVGHGKSSLV